MCVTSSKSKAVIARALSVNESAIHKDLNYEELRRRMIEPLRMSKSKEYVQ